MTYNLNILFLIILTHMKRTECILHLYRIILICFGKPGIAKNKIMDDNKINVS